MFTYLASRAVLQCPLSPSSHQTNPAGPWPSPLRSPCLLPGCTCNCAHRTPWGSLLSRRWSHHPQQSSPNSDCRLPFQPHLPLPCQALVSHWIKGCLLSTTLPVPPGPHCSTGTPLWFSLRALLLHPLPLNCKASTFESEKPCSPYSCPNCLHHPAHLFQPSFPLAPRYPNLPELLLSGFKYIVILALGSSHRWLTLWLE